LYRKIAVKGDAGPGLKLAKVFQGVKIVDKAERRRNENENDGNLVG
jgi:hypothetical protein